MSKVRLGDICTIRKGTKVEQIEHNDDAIRFIQIEDLRNENNIKYCWPNKKYVVVNPNDLIIAWDGANAGTIGFGLNGAIGSTLAMIRLNINNLETRYVGLLLRSKFTYLRNNCTGATIPHISRKSLENIQIPLPPLETQKQIAQTLDTAAELLVMRKQQLAELDNLIKSTFYEMFGDPVMNEKGWDVVMLSDFYDDSRTSVKCGPFGSALKKDEYVEHGIPVWTMDNITKQGDFVDEVYLYITEEKYNDLENYNVKKNDIIISRAGTVGKMCVVISNYDKSIISTNLIRLRLNHKIVPLYIVKLIMTWGNRVCRLKTGDDGAFTHMNTGVLDNISFPYPPLTLQKKFAAIVNKIEEQKDLVKKAIDETQYLFDSLMSQYFD